ncbi:Hypothetical protein CINCED_3A021682 [Cinara cedri]|uniref:Uncharacterized protein n=1 Tax=Cinara cedri TaxID=506608 RepID=A0A5E4MFJ5_9HEMI|nr:Hypothetical protein CINCED_3A021682 [Cinara cedri]
MSCPEHVWRPDDITKDLLNWKPEGKRPLDRPKKRSMDKLNRNFRILGVHNPEEIANNKRRPEETAWSSDGP